MKKNIIIIFLIITSVVFGVLSLINKIEADSQTEFAIEQLRIAEENRELAQSQIIIVEDATIDALRQKAIAEDLLKKCSGDMVK